MARSRGRKNGRKRRSISGRVKPLGNHARVASAASAEVKPKSSSSAEASFRKTMAGIHRFTFSEKIRKRAAKVRGERPAPSEAHTHQQHEFRESNRAKAEAERERIRAERQARMGRR